MNLQAHFNAYLKAYFSFFFIVLLLCNITKTAGRKIGGSTVLSPDLRWRTIYMPFTCSCKISGSVSFARNSSDQLYMLFTYPCRFNDIALVLVQTGLVIHMSMYMLVCLFTCPCVWLVLAQISLALTIMYMLFTCPFRPTASVSSGTSESYNCRRLWPSRRHSASVFEWLSLTHGGAKSRKISLSPKSSGRWDVGLTRRFLNFPLG